MIQQISHSWAQNRILYYIEFQKLMVAQDPSKKHIWNFTIQVIFHLN